MILALMSDINAIVFPTWLKDEAFGFGPISVKWYGLAYLVGIFGAYYYASRIAARKDVWLSGQVTRLPELIPNKVMLQDLMFYCLLGIIIGGRLGYILFYSTSTIWTDPVEIFKIWTGGMSFHGGFLGVCAGVYYMHWRHKLGLMRIADLTAIGAPIGLGLVRLTNFINQELYGRVTDVPWAFIFKTAPDSQPRHPSQLYESFLEGLVIWLILRILCTKFKALTRPGVCAGTFIMLYGIFRFSVEFVREPDNIPQFEPLTRGMVYSLPMIFVGLAIIIWAARRTPVSPKYPVAPK
ncbi:prolipoprotein diacylglyceryl transferase [Litorimonas taeanensis]|uniref:Phosphatidylglycerol--prolipoprotein diacylglyceryl transferase n=1 Tax=Litorimonas taeanensis TaxID=568099 RepID=A0A420WJW6_9PROT|nr:prolipoprotein diacylglyceryl transferase [Litorimonas taeanensis]RKQ71239.1 prolipoprotein diacylglyceryl transferase [Litorimonas taeanensis]